MKTIQEMMDVMLHFAMGGKVEVIGCTPNEEWVPTQNPTWAWDANDYRIAKPEPKVVKFEAWLCKQQMNGYTLEYFTPESIKWQAREWTRVPSLDLTGEIEQ